MHDYFSGSGRRLEAGETFSAPLAENASAFYLVAPIGKSGMAFLGDQGKFVGTGRQRIASIEDQPGKLMVGVLLGESEKSVTLHGYASVAPQVTVQSGSAGPVRFDAARNYFSVELVVGETVPLDRSAPDPVRHLTVIFETPGK